MQLKTRLLSQKARMLLERDPVSTMAIMDGIASPRKIARKLLPDLKKQVSFEPKLDTVAKIIERQFKAVAKEKKIGRIDIQQVRRTWAETRIAIRNDIGVVSFKTGPDLKAKLDSILSLIYKNGDSPVFNASLGREAMTLITDQKHLNAAIKIIGRRNVRYTKKDQSVLSIISPPDVLDTAGFAAYGFNLLSLRGISFSEVLSSYDEGMIVLEEEEGTRAYELLSGEIRRLRSIYA